MTTTNQYSKFRFLGCIASNFGARLFNVQTGSLQIYTRPSFIFFLQLRNNNWEPTKEPLVNNVEKHFRFSQRFVFGFNPRIHPYRNIHFDKLLTNPPSPSVQLCSGAPGLQSNFCRLKTVNTDTLQLAHRQTAGRARGGRQGSPRN